MRGEWSLFNSRKEKSSIYYFSGSYGSFAIQGVSSTTNTVGKVRRELQQGVAKKPGAGVGYREELDIVKRKGT